MEVFPDIHSIPDDMALRKLREAEEHADNGNYINALRLLKEAEPHASDPDLKARIFMNLGDAYYNMGSLDGAEASFRRAAELADDPRLKLELGRQFVGRKGIKDLRAACRLWREAADKVANPREREFLWSKIAYAHGESGDHALAIDAWKKALALMTGRVSKDIYENHIGEAYLRLCGGGLSTYFCEQSIAHFVNVGESSPYTHLEAQRGIREARRLMAFGDHAAFTSSNILPDVNSYGNGSGGKPESSLLSVNSNGEARFTPQLKATRYTPRIGGRDEIRAAASGEKGPGGDVVFTVSPPFSGAVYYRDGVAERFDSGTKEWVIAVSPGFFTHDKSVAAEQSVRMIVDESTTPLPMPYGYSISAGTVRFDGEVPDHQIVRDIYGNFYLVMEERPRAPVTLNYGIGYDPEPYDISFVTPETKERMLAGVKLPKDLAEELAGLKSSGAGVMEKAQSLRDFFIERFRYIKEDHPEAKALNAYYMEDGKARYFERIFEKRVVDCDMANTVFIALLREIGVPSRLARGYWPYEDAEILQSVHGHGWTEVWDEADGRWTVVEAVPPNVLEERERVADAMKAPPEGADNFIRWRRLTPEAALEARKKRREDLHLERLNEVEAIIEGLRESGELRGIADIAVKTAREFAATAADYIERPKDYWLRAELALGIVDRAVDALPPSGDLDAQRAYSDLIGSILDDTEGRDLPAIMPWEIKGQGWQQIYKSGRLYRVKDGSLDRVDLNGYLRPGSWSLKLEPLTDTAYPDIYPLGGPDGEALILIDNDAAVVMVDRRPVKSYQFNGSILGSRGSGDGGAVAIALKNREGDDVTYEVVALDATGIIHRSGPLSYYPYFETAGAGGAFVYANHLDLDIDHSDGNNAVLFDREREVRFTKDPDGIEFGDVSFKGDDYMRWAIDAFPYLVLLRKAGTAQTLHVYDSEGEIARTPPLEGVRHWKQVPGSGGFVISADGARGLYLFDPKQPGSVERLAVFENELISPMMWQFSSDGSRMAFYTKEEGRDGRWSHNVYVIDIPGKRVLYKTAVSPLFLRPILQLSGDGRRIAIAYATISYNDRDEDRVYIDLVDGGGGLAELGRGPYYRCALYDRVSTDLRYSNNPYLEDQYIDNLPLKIARHLLKGDGRTTYRPLDTRLIAIFDSMPYAIDEISPEEYASLIGRTSYILHTKDGERENGPVSLRRAPSDHQGFREAAFEYGKKNLKEIVASGASEEVITVLAFLIAEEAKDGGHEVFKQVAAARPALLAGAIFYAADSWGSDPRIFGYLPAGTRETLAPFIKEGLEKRYDGVKDEPNGVAAADGRTRRLMRFINYLRPFIETFGRDVLPDGLRSAVSDW